MVNIHYHIVQHDGGWAYQVDGIFSEPFASHAAALNAARHAARRQLVPGETTTIQFEDASGHWHEELSEGNDRPMTDVVD